MDADVLLKLVSGIAPVIAAVVVVLGIAALAGRTTITLGRNFKLHFDRSRAEVDDIRHRLEDAGNTDKGSQQYVLLREYHAQGLAQSRMSFWFSLIFASIGFAVIALSIGFSFSNREMHRPGGSTLPENRSLRLWLAQLLMRLRHCFLYNQINHDN
jgi:hypothetical protein